MSLVTKKSYDLKPTVFTRESMFSVAELLNTRMQQLVQNEATERTNADQTIVNNFTSAINLINQELAQVRLLAESLGDAELAQLEGSLLRVLQQPAFAELLSGGTLEGFKLNSIVLALASQPDPAWRKYDAPVHGVATSITMGFTDGRQSTLTAALTPVPADDVAGTPERMVYQYETSDFLGLPAQQTVTYNVFRFTGSDKLWLEEYRTDLVLFDLTAKFLAAGPTPTLDVPDLNADSRIGVRDPVAEARVVLDAALAEKAAAVATAAVAATALADAQALATLRADDYAALQTGTAQQVTDAQALVGTKTTARDDAQALFAQAQQDLATAQETGGDVESAAAALETRRQELQAVVDDLATAQTALDALVAALSQAANLSAQAAAAVSAQQSAHDALQATATAKTQAAADAQTAYDAAVLAAG